METSHIFLLALVITLAVMFLTWAYAVKIENFGIVDAVWAFCFTIHMVIFDLFTQGAGPRKWLLLVMVGVWSLRLGFYLAKRIASHHPHEDTRYIKLRADYGSSYKLRFLLFYFYQAISVSFLTFPFIFVFKNTAAELTLLEWTGFALWAVAVIGESVADCQKSRFRADVKNNDKVCDVGLWRYSRHPNYFFESLIWWGYFTLMLATPNLWWSVYTPLTMTLLLVKVTGVPPAEQQSLKRHGEAFRAYQRRTSVFIPWFSKV